MKMTASPDADKQLVARAKRGDKTAFDLLVIKYQQKVRKVVGRFLQEPADAEDATQETFIRVYQAIGKFRGDSALYTWIYRIAVNTAKNHLAISGRLPSSRGVDLDVLEALPLDRHPLSDSASPDNELERMEVEQQVFATIRELPEDIGAALCLREIEGLSYKQIADVMGCPLGTVRSRIFRGREVIAAKLKGMG